MASRETAHPSSPSSTLPSRRTGVLEGDILAVIDGWECPVKRAAAHAVIEEEEARGAAALALAPGVRRLLARLDAARIPRGLVTRNNGAAVDVFHGKLAPVAPFAPALARGWGGLPKPAPDPVAACAAAWGLCASEVVMVGDSLEDDVVAGAAAGAATILIDAARHARGDAADWGAHPRPDAVARCLEHVDELLEELFELVPPERRAA